MIKPNIKNINTEKMVEATSWFVMILILIFFRFLPKSMIDSDSSYILIGIIISFALLYYLVIDKLPYKKKFYIKNISDIILISVLIHIAKDYGIYFFSLYFLPIVSAALALEIGSTLLMATLACLFVVVEIILQSQDLLFSDSSRYSEYFGVWQIALIVIVTLFCRFLAIQIKQEKTINEKAIKEKIKAVELETMQRELTANAAHQLLTPLSITRGDLSVILAEDFGKIKPKQKQLLDDAYINTKRIIHLVNDLLVVSKLEGNKLPLVISKTNISLIIRELIKEFDMQIKSKKIDVTFNNSGDTPDAYVDKQKTQQILYNIFDNAIKYTSKGKIELRLEHDKNNVIIVVSDTGIGIPEKDQDKIFTRFFRASNSLEVNKEGTGLGLSIAKILAESQSGKIWLAFSSAAGTCFKISFPINNRSNNENTDNRR